MKKNIICFIIIFLIIGHSKATANNVADNPSSYIENKALVAYLEKEQFEINISMQDAINKYNFRTCRKVRTAGYADVCDCSKCIDGINGSTLYTYIRLDNEPELILDHNSVVTGFIYGKVDQNGRLKSLTKNTSLADSVSDANLKEIENQFASKYNTFWTSCIYDYNGDDAKERWTIHHPITYYIKYHNRYIIFEFQASRQNDKTVLSCTIFDNNVEERLRATQDQKKDKGVVDSLKKSF